MRPTHRALVGSAAFSVLIGMFATSALADSLGRLRISLELHGTSEWTGAGGEWKKSKVDDSYSTEVVLKQGVPQNTNQWDPESGKRLAERAAAAQQRAAELREQAARAAANRPGGGNRPAAGPAGMDMAQMMAMRDKVQACGADNACKQKIAMQMMQGGGAGGAPPGVNADMMAITSMCQNEKKQTPGTKGFQECIETAGKQLEAARMPPAGPSGAASAAGAANGKLVEALPDDPDIDRYMPYWSHVDDWSCTFKGHTKIQRSFEGAEADVAGLLKVSGSEAGEGDADPKQICNHSVVILETKTNKLWAAEFKIVAVPVTSAQKGGLMNGHTATEVEGAFNATGYEATIDGQHYDSPMAWVLASLSGGALSGERTQEFVNTRTVSGISAGGKGTGKLTAKLTWSFTKE
jgi:hypothetical protein